MSDYLYCSRDQARIHYRVCKERCKKKHCEDLNKFLESHGMVDLVNKKKIKRDRVK